MSARGRGSPFISCFSLPQFTLGTLTELSGQDTDH